MKFTLLDLKFELKQRANGLLTIVDESLSVSSSTERSTYLRRVTRQSPKISPRLKRALVNRDL